MKKTIVKVRNLISATKVAIMTVVLTGVSSVQAALPTTANPTNAPAQGNYIELIKGYAHDILIVGGLLIGAVAFIAVAKNCIATYSEIGAGKKTWGDMGMHALMGVLLLVFVVYLLTEAATVIF